MQASPYSNDEYTIGWISALNEEFIIAMAMLDEEHGRPQSTPRDDTNAYHLGRIGAHNITMACLSGGQMGTGPAAIVAENMRRTFKNVRFALLVGIGGGVPNGKKDIRLGDIVVSYPDGTYTGVVQYDYGKLNGNGDIERKDWFCAPPPKVLAAANSLRAYHTRPKNPHNNIPVIIDELGEQYTYPEEHLTTDLLFRADYDHHPGAETCDSCDKEALVQRKARNSTSNPHVHYGIIASGSMVVRNGTERDKIDQRYGNKIFCFDMEAAGLMNNFPCLVIRGISDYSDSHKNDEWRKRATAVASAYAKELLSLIEPSDVDVLPPMLEAVSQNIASLGESTAENTKLLRNAENEARQRELKNLQMECERWLKPPNVRQIQQDRIEARHPGTCDWIWSNTTFTNWKALTPTSPLDGLLCVSGPPGCGKSILASSIVDHMRKNKTDALFFAFTGMYASHLKFDSLVRSFLSQLLQGHTEEQAIRILQNFMLKGQLTISDLWRAFSMIADTFIAEPIYCVIDGVDESEDLVHELVQRLFGFLQSHSNFRFIVLGRSHAFHATDYVKHTIQIDPTLTKGDVDTVIEAEIRQSGVFLTPDLRTEVRRTLTDQCEGNLLWIKLMVEHLNKSVGVADVFKRLRGLPRDLQTAYETLLCGLVGRLERSELNLARKVFAFIIVSQRPLSLDELQYLLAADAMSKTTRRENCFEEHLILRPDRKILDVCGGLVNFIGDHLRLVHFSVMEFLIRPKSQWSHSRRSRKIQQFRVTLKQAHGWIAAASITYLETCYYSYQTHDWTKSPQLVKHNQLLGYSSQYSITHITQSDIKPGVIAAKIDKFLKSDRCVPWIENLIIGMIDDESLDSQPMEVEKFMSWLDEAGHSLGLLQRAQTCLKHEIDRRSQQYGQNDSRTERIRLFLGVVQDRVSSTGLQAVEPSSVGSIGAPTDISSILQLLRNETPLSLELKADLLLKLQLHLQKVKRLTDPLQILFRILLEKASGLPIYALLIVGEFYCNVGKFEQALEIYFAALDKLEESEVPLKYLVIHNIGFTYRRLYQHDKALEHYIRAITGREKILGPEHKDTLTTINNIGVAYSYLGEYNKALEYYTRAFAGREKLLGPEHKDTLSTINNIGVAYSYLGEHNKALEYCTRALTGREKILGPEHKDTLTTINNIGCTYYNLGEYNKALEYSTRALAGREKILGPEHKDTLSTIHEIGLIWDGLSQHDEASEYFSILTGEEDEMTGPGCEDTLPTVNDIDNAYDSLEQYDISPDDLEQTLSGQEKNVSKLEGKNTKMIQKLLCVICCNFQR